MSVKLKVVASEGKSVCDPEEITKLIKSGLWPSQEELDIKEFVIQTQESPNEYVPRAENILQSRDVTYNPNYVQTQVIKSKNGDTVTEKESSATVVYFPSSTMVWGSVIDADTYKLIDRTHGMLIDAYLGKTKKLTNIVNYEHDLDSDESELNALANLLNIPEKSEQGLSNGSIELEIWRKMDKNEREGKPAKPSDAYRETILRRYPQINSHIYSNFISNHRSGGRRSPIVSYSEHEIDSFYNSLENMVCYDDYHIVRPAKIKTCFGGTLGYAISHCTESGKKKILMPLFAGTTKQAEDMKLGDLKKEIEDKMKKIAKHIKIKIKILWMKYE